MMASPGDSLLNAPAKIVLYSAEDEGGVIYGIYLSTRDLKR